MQQLILPKEYQPALDIRGTEIAIKEIKDFFERELARALNLTRVSAPLFVTHDSGLNDNLSGKERPVSFDINGIKSTQAEIVHSLAKWKRLALARYGFTCDEGLYTDMNAIRRDEDADNLHSFYVDQWDWEYVIAREQRTQEELKGIVSRIYDVCLRTEDLVYQTYGIAKQLPSTITFITSQELEDTYPSLSPKQREYAACKEHGAVFLMQIGMTMQSGQKHDDRAPDYDDWSRNGDILFYYPLLDLAMEMSSMGIRVDAQTLTDQLSISGHDEWAEQAFHKELLAGHLPQTIGGGIGQSRLCMFFLQKAHIGEVHASIWPQEMIVSCQQAGIWLL